VRLLNGHFSEVSLFEVKVETQVVGISFLDLLEFIANVKFVTEVFELKRNHDTFIKIYIYMCMCTSRFLQVLAG
jgi:23S rRNA U2552 (ribose-2'-O)-methylase RlmE/FtsJ